MTSESSLDKDSWEDTDKARVLVTGGAGFIGHNLVKSLLRRGFSVSIIDDFSTGYRDNVENLPVRLVEGSINDPHALRAAMEGCQSVVHLAALGSVPRSIADPERTHDVNVNGTLSVLEAARSLQVNHVIFSSSSSVYGLNPAMPKSEREWVRPMSPYAVSKLAGEQYVLAYQQSFGLKTLAFRFFNVYGPGQRAGHAYAAVVPIFLEAALACRPLPINGSGENSRDFTFVGTVCDVLTEAVESKAGHDEPVNLAFGTNTSILALAATTAKLAGAPLEYNFRPPRPGDVPHSQADNTTLRHLFPDIAPVSLEVGLAQTWRWYCAQ